MMYEMPAVYEPTSAADLRRHYAGVIKRNRPVAPRPIVVIKPVSRFYTREQAREFMESAHAMIESPTGLPSDSFTPADILFAVCKAGFVSAKDLKGERRFAPIVAVRQAFAHLAYENTSLSLTGIGLVLGGCDHSTIHHGLKVAGRELSECKGRVYGVITRAKSILEGKRS